MVAVIGGGAAGIVAAVIAARAGARVTIYEKTTRLGTKILISGGGKCNITHDGPIEDVLRAFRPNEARFLRPGFYRFPPSEIVSWLTERGLRVYTRPDGRIFPVDQTAKDVVAILTAIVRDTGVDVRYESPAQGLVGGPEGITGVVIDGRTFEHDRVIVTTGGASYPQSGTTGDGWQWAKDLGIPLVHRRAALAPIFTEPARPEFAGVALRDIVLKARQSGKEITRWRGDLLFTHHGVSGPTVLGVSREVAERMDRGEIRLTIDFFPDDSFETLTERLASLQESSGRKQAASIFEQWVPAKLAPWLGQLASIDPAAEFRSLGKKDRNRLVEVLKLGDIGRVKNVVFAKGEVVAGGVSLDAVDPQTMAYPSIPGLFFAGEVLDIAGPVGGYNLQAAWSTGFIAGESAAR